MRASVVALMLVAAVSGFEKPLRGYHAAVGIPEAERIKAAEEQIVRWNPDRIVGGANAPVNAHPYLAGLLINLLGIVGQSVCGSSLISSNRLVTAAHCWFDGANQATLFTVVLGSQFLFNGGTRIATSTVIVHPQYTFSTLSNDIAMIYLPSNVFFSNSIRPVALPSGMDLFETFAGQWSVAAGYGKTSDWQTGVTQNTLVSHVNLQVITVSQCQISFGSVFVQSSTICTNGAGGVGICGGDSGGPLVVNRNNVPTLIGISSFVASTGCQQGHPSAFARVTSFYNFITQHL